MCDKNCSLSLDIRFRLHAATFRAEFHGVLRECLCKSAERPRENPRPRVFPSRQERGYNIRMCYGRQHSVSFGENRRPFWAVVLTGQPALGKGIKTHSFASNRSRAMRST